MRRGIERRHASSAPTVAAIACVEPKLVYLTERGGTLSRAEVERTLRRLSQVSGLWHWSETVGGTG